MTSRDPARLHPFRMSKFPGGMFLDMTIHDFNMARYLSGSDVVEVYAAAAGVMVRTIPPEYVTAGGGVVDTSCHYALFCRMAPSAPSNHCR